jgi:hypothetical protein
VSFEDILVAWSKPPASTKPRHTHETIRDVLHSSDLLKPRRIETYLQGSYKNSTNIRSDSDVDIVCQTEIFLKDISRLTSSDLAIYNSRYSDAGYTFAQYKTDVFNVLVQAYQSDVSMGKKSIKVKGNTARLNADVVPAFTYRLYLRMTPTEQYYEGMAFFDQAGTLIVNYPKVHYKNGTDKSIATNGRYKDLVRIIKNMRNWLADKGELDKKVAPSYFIECLVYNVSNECFIHSSYEASFSKVWGSMNWLLGVEHLKAGSLMQANGLVPLFGSNGWALDNADMFIRLLKQFA